MSLQINLTGKVALVTGGAVGIGRGIAEMLAQAGATVVVNDIDAEGGRATADALRVEFIHADVSEEAAVTAMASTIDARHGALHLLVNNAGIATFRGIAETEPSDWDRLLDVDLKGVYRVTRACLSLLERSAPASVVNIASVHAQMTVSTMTAYAAAKGGVVAMTRSLAQELGPLGVRVNAVSPGFVDTPLFRRWLMTEPDQAASLARVLGIIPVGHVATAAEIGALVTFLASDLARSINGANYVVDGGLTTRLMH